MKRKITRRVANTIWFTAYLFMKEKCANLFRKNLKVTAPRTIGSYELAGVLSASEFREVPWVYLYRDKNTGREGVAKIWRSRFKNYDYYSLQNEAALLSVLKETAIRAQPHLPADLCDIGTPELYAVSESKDRLTLLTEYFESEELRSRPAPEQVASYLKSLKFLNALRNSLSKREESFIGKRMLLSLLSSYPVLLCLALALHPKHANVIVRAGKIFLKSVPILFGRRHTTTLVHRDLHTKNILVRNGSMKIIDVGNTVLGDVLFDPAITLVREWHNTAFRDLFLREMHSTNFLTENDRKAFFGLLAYHAIHALTMVTAQKRGAGYLEILRFILKENREEKSEEKRVEGGEEKKMHIDVITKYFHPVAGGIENNIMQTYSHLADQYGWDVTIHTSKDTYTTKNSLAKEETIQGLTVRRYERTIFGIRPDIDWRNTHAVALHNFDVFFARYLLRALFLKITGRKKFALLLTPHGGFSPEWSMFPPLARLVKKIYTHTLGAWLINTAVDDVRAVSEWERSEMIRYVASPKVHLIDNGLEDEAYEDIDALASAEIKKATSGYGRYIIQIARVYPIKNIETAIKALAKLPSDVKFVIVGQLQDAEYEKKLQTLAAKLGVRERVVFAGVIRGADKYYLMRHAVAMVHMAMWESFCNVVNEGLSQGTPCIVSNVYALPYLVKDRVNGFSLPVRDHRQVALKVRWLLDPGNAEAVFQMRESNKKFGMGKSWKDVAQKMDMVYRNAIPKKI